MNPEKKQHLFNSIKMTLRKDQIASFVAGLHEIQEEMLEELVRRSEAKGFPEATQVIDHIKSL